MNLARLRPKAHHPTQHGGTCQTMFTCLEDDPFVERLAFVFIRLANKDADQCAILWKLHDYLQIRYATIRPSQTSMRPNITLAPTFAKAFHRSPSRSRLIVSLPNEEKVVKPPRIPINTNTLDSEVNT